LFRSFCRAARPRLADHGFGVAFFGFTVMLFGRKSKADDPHDTDSEI
jgi:hypothetical protein